MPNSIPQGYNVFFDIIQEIQDEGIALPFRPILNFIGTGVTATEDSPNNRINVDIPGNVQPHNLLDGSQNQDTVANAVTRGDLIVGNASPLWDVLNIGTALQQLRVNAGGLDLEYFTPAPATSFYQTIQDEGIALPQQPTFNFIGPIVTAVDDPANNRTNITITGGGGVNTFIFGFADDSSISSGDGFASFFADGVDGTEGEGTGFVAFTFTIKRVTIHVGTNSSDGITDIVWRDDGVDVPNTTFNIPASTTGSFDSGAISESITANSLINLKLTRNGSSTFGDYSIYSEVEK